MRVYFLLLVSVLVLPLSLQTPDSNIPSEPARVSVESVGAILDLSNRPGARELEGKIESFGTAVGSQSGFDRFKPIAIEAAASRNDLPQTGAATQSQGFPSSEPLRIGDSTGVQRVNANESEVPQSNQSIRVITPVGNTGNPQPSNPR